MHINQRLYLLSQGMDVQALHTLFTGLILSKIAYASFAGQLTADDRNRTGAISLRRGVTRTAFVDSADRKLFTRITQPGHCLCHILPLCILPL